MNHLGILPESWQWFPMGEVATIVGGGTPKTNELSNFEGGEIPWITPADLSGYMEKYIGKGARNITERGLANSSARLLPTNTVLFSSRAPIGYVAIASQPVATNQGFKSFVLPEGIDPSYCYFFLLGAKETIQTLGGGTTFKEISGAAAATIPFALAPLPEQHRIVAEIEKQFTRLDASVESLKRAQANLKRYRASVLKAACEGTLVATEAELARAEGQGYEPASVLLERILAERRARWESQENKRGKYKEPAAPDTSELPELPEGWAWGTVAQLSTIGTGSTPLTSNEEYYQDGTVPWVTSSALNEASISEPNGYVTEVALEECRLKLYPPHTLLIAMYGEGKTRGKCSELLLTSTINQAIAAVVLEESALHCRLYLKNFMQSNYENARRLSSGGVQPNLNMGLVGRIPVPLPPLSEQYRIVAEVERRLSVIQQSEATVEASLKRAERLRQSILKRAFSGQLVPQDLNDEPASVLLERIKEEREEAKNAETPKAKARRPRGSPTGRGRAARQQQLSLPEVSP